MSRTHTRLQRGSLVFVTGATGLVGSAVTEELIKRGYKVRAATRDASKTIELAAKLNKLYGPGMLETVVVKDIAAADAYNEVLKGVSGILHIATDTSLSSDTEAVVGSAQQATVGLLKAAAKVPSVKAFVLTSSRIAIYNPEDGKDGEYSLDTFANHFYPYAQSLASDDPLKTVLSYAASKVEGEKAAWDFIKTKKPSYSFNVILPDLVLGPIANPAPGLYSTASWAIELFNGKCDGQIVGFMNPSARIVDVRDVALLHYAALVDADTDRQRLWAAAHEPSHLNDFLRIWRKAYPERTLPSDFDFSPSPKQIIDTSASVKLLQKYAERSWIDYEKTILDLVKDQEA